MRKLQICKVFATRYFIIQHVLYTGLDYQGCLLEVCKDREPSVELLLHKTRLQYPSNTYVDTT